MSEANPNYKCHDYVMLIRRWKKICKLSNLNFHEVENMDGYPCYEICSSLKDTQNINYISAGIHGDNQLHPPDCFDGRKTVFLCFQKSFLDLSLFKALGVW